MNTVEKEPQSLVSLVVWLIWIATIIAVLGGAIYLFIGGSTLFTQHTQEPIVVYRTSHEGTISLTGSLLLPNSCTHLMVDNTGTALRQELRFTFEKVRSCKKAPGGGVPETFFVQFLGDENTVIDARVGGITRELLIK
jgi:hypothetical protein